jgi:hypothetical protein
MRAFCAAALLAIGLAPQAPAPEAPLPELRSFLTEAREHLRDDWRLATQYTYIERRTEYRRRSDGKEEPSSIKVFEVYPGGDPSHSYRKLIEVDGKPLSAEELAANDREHQRKVQERQRARDAETPAERAARTKREDDRARQEQETWDDLIRVYDFAIAGRERVEGRPLIVVTFTPKPNAAPQSDIGARMTKVKGRAWISETDYQVARVDAQVLDDISFGWGILGKLYAGATGSYTRRKVNDELWLPVTLQYTGSGRALVKHFTVHTVVDYSGYHKFSVNTETAFTTPKKP